MVNFPYGYIKGKDEDDLLAKLTRLSVSEGFTFKIINIYPRGRGCVGWYYASKRTVG